LRIDNDRLGRRLAELATIGAIAGTDGCSRLALSDEDRVGRDLVVGWMSYLDLEVFVDGIGNVTGVMRSDSARRPVMCGSHIDTVRTGGRFDGNLGVLAGLEVIETVMTAGVELQRPLAVSFYPGEEGARFAPDMIGSLVYVGGMSLEQALAVEGIDGALLGQELERIGYAGEAPIPGLVPHAFVELHIEQGPVLEAEEVTIGAVTGVQGISWQEVTVTGQSNHAGTTPTHLRRDPGVVAATVTFTLDLRNTEEGVLREAERRFAEFLMTSARAEGCTATVERLARFEPVSFDADIVDIVENVATELGHSVMRLASGAGHDAQMLARVCPTTMVFTPTQNGLSHNPAEYTSPQDFEAGANVLMQTMVHLAQERSRL